SASSPAEGERRGPRRVRLTLARLDPFSVMTLSFLVAIAIGMATVGAVVRLSNRGHARGLCKQSEHGAAELRNIVTVTLLDLLSLCDVLGRGNQVDQLGRALNKDEPLRFMDFFSFSKMVSYGTVVAVVNVVIITALGTLLAFLYNIVAALLGGLKLTFTDE